MISSAVKSFYLDFAESVELFLPLVQVFHLR